MSLSNLAIAKTDDLPIHHRGDVHSGKVRSVYWLSAEDSARIIEERGYDVTPGTELAVMVISDRISAYEIIWQGEDGLQGVPGKGLRLMLRLFIGLMNLRKLGWQAITFLSHLIPWYGLCRRRSL